MYNVDLFQLLEEEDFDHKYHFTSDFLSPLSTGISIKTIYYVICLFLAHFISCLVKQTTHKYIFMDTVRI